ncbi:MAG: alkaline phosphatase family protein [Acidobacteriota bacterium]
MSRLLTLLAAGALLVGCRADKPAPALVIGIDGAEWRVIRELWQAGELPNLHGLAERGTTATLQTAYNASPVIWTTIATGVTPSEHGITDFVVPGPNGDVPISSSVRRVPALWSMLSRVHRRVAVVGWWGSWPAEDVDGVVVSDRALLDIESRVSPAEYLPRLQAAVERARASTEFHSGSEAELRDATMAAVATDLLGEPFDLTLLYFRSADIVSHLEWRENSGASVVAGGPEVARIYRAIDQAIGRVLKAAGSSRNVLVISDHGFRTARETEIRTLSDFDAALTHLGYQVRTTAGVDFSRSQMYSYGSPHYRRKKLVRFSARGREPGGAVLESERGGLLSKLNKDLNRVRYAEGSPVFLLRPAGARERRAGADFVVLLSPEHASTAVQIDGVDVHDVVLEVSRLSGTHDSGNDGIFIAAGPTIQPGASLEGIRVHDITPTVLYGLDLPVAENFAGRPWTELYRSGYREKHPLRSIRSWGASRPGAVRASPADEKLLQELRSLGYIR